MTSSGGFSGRSATAEMSVSNSGIVQFLVEPAVQTGRMRGPNPWRCVKTSKYQREVAHRGQEHQALRGGPQDTASSRRLGAERVPDGSRARGPNSSTTACTALAHSTIVVRPGASAPGSDAVVAGQIEGDDAVPGLDQRFDEDAQVGLTALPACVHQVRRVAVHPMTRR